MPIEMVTLIEEENIKISTDLFNSIYRSGNVPKYWLYSVFVTFLKIGKPRMCKDLRTNISHAKNFYKTYTKPYLLKMRKPAHRTLIWFIDELDTREPMLFMRVLIEM